MKKSLITTFVLSILMVFALTSCQKANRPLTQISDNEICASGEFEKGTSLKSNQLAKESEDYLSALGKVDSKQIDEEKISIYELSLEKDGNKIEPLKPVTITLPKPFESRLGYQTFHIKNDDSVEILETIEKDQVITFTTTSFSTFIVAGKVPDMNQTYNFMAYADTDAQGKLLVNKEEKTVYLANLNENDEVHLNAIPNAGYDFAGWYKGSKISGNNDRYVDFKEDAYFRFDGTAIEIYARFMPIDYSITYELNGGTLKDSLVTTYNVESEDIILPTPTKEYYRFDGWMNGDEVITKIEKGSTGDISLIAKWTQSAGLPRSIEINKEVIGDIEQEENVLLPNEYSVTQNGSVILGSDLKTEDGVVTIEYKPKDASDNAYTSTLPSELGDYLVRVRISQSITTPYYIEAVSSPKNFSLVERVIKTKFNVLGNYRYDKYTLGTNKIVKYDLEGANVLELDDVVGGENKIYGYQNTEIPIANLVFEECAEKYTEIRIGSKDGIAIGRLVMYGVKFFSINEYDENGNYIRQNNDYFYVCVQGEALDTSITRVAFELLPNVTGYTDSEGNWISEEKNLDVYTYTHYTNDNPKQKNIGYAVNFDDYRYNNYEDNPALNQLSYALNDASYNVENAYYRFEPWDNLKYDVEISGDVEIYNLNLLTHKITKVEKQSFMTICYQSQNDTLSHESKYVFVLKKGAKVTVYNGKAFTVEK